MKRPLNNLQIAFATVFVHASYIAIAGTLGAVAFLLAVWFPNLGVIGTVLSDPSVPPMAKLSFAFSLLGGIVTNFDLLSAGYTIAIAVLFGVNTATIVYLFKQRRAAVAGQNIAIGSGAMASGVLGIGCAACGSLIAGGVFSFIGAGGALALLPLNGGEFGIVSVALLVISLLLVSRNIAEPPSCSLPSPAEQASPTRGNHRHDRWWRRKPRTTST